MAKDPRAQRRVIFVLGMHRSGTSALARGVGALGADLGARLKPPLPGDNEKGFWEDADLSAINDELLAALGCRWDSMSLGRACFDDGKKLRPFAAAARRVLGERLAHAPLFAFKDPRSCVTLPFWQAAAAALDAEDAYVIALRSPPSVALSLERRDGFAPFKSDFLWFIHLAAAASATQGRRRVYVDFDELMADPAKQLARIASGLGDKRLAPARPEVKAYRNEFLDGRLHHHRASAKEGAAQSGGLPLATELYLELKKQTLPKAPALSAGRHRARLLELLPIGEHLEAQEPLAKLGKDYQALHDELARVNAARAKEARDAAGELAALSQRAGKAEAAGAELRAELERERAGFEQQLAAAGKQSAEAAKYAESLAAHAREAESYAQSLKRDLDATRTSFENELAALRQQSAEAVKYAESLKRELDAVRQSYDAERAAWSASSAEAERYALSLVKRAEEAERYAKALEQELAALRSPRRAS